MTHPRFRIPWLSVDMASLRGSLLVVLFTGGSHNSVWAIREELLEDIGHNCHLRKDSPARDCSHLKLLCEKKNYKFEIIVEILGSPSQGS